MVAPHFARDTLAILRIPADEPVFVLRAQDRAAVHAIRQWIGEAEALGAPFTKIEGALADLRAFTEWQKTHPTKVPD